jgi:hypothetical protein
MKTFLHSTGLVATLLGTLLIGAGSAAMSDQSAALVKSDRLPLPRYSGQDYVTVETRIPNGSQLCRIPIEIGMWNNWGPGICR